MKNSFEFTAQSIICNGKSFPATYSVTPSGAVTVFADVGDGLPAVRVQFRPGHDAHAAALAAAQAAEAAPVEAEVPAPVETEVPAPVETAPTEAAEAPQAPEAQQAPDPAPQTTEAPQTSADPADKPWIGSTISGKGWRIIFDAAAERTRVIIDGSPSDAMRAAVEEARFFWSPKMQSWNKKLSCKAHRAALELAETLEKIA